MARKINAKYPGSIITYLDAGFPFIDHFPLLPHRSHHDGKKLDLSFFYKDGKTNERLHHAAPSWIGYGVCEEPLPGETNMPQTCAKKGYWQYNFIQSITSQARKQTMTFDSDRTRDLITLFAQHPLIGKIFIEPHLKTRMRLDHPKIRFHGCQAVRHDDHIHVQLR